MQTVDMNQRELLIRLDERVKQMQLDVSKLATTTVPMNEHVQLMKSMVDHTEKIGTLEEFNTRFKVYLAVAVAGGGIISALAVSLIKDFLSGLFK